MLKGRTLVQVTLAVRRIKAWEACYDNVQMQHLNNLMPYTGCLCSWILAGLATVPLLSKFSMC